MCNKDLIKENENLIKENQLLKEKLEKVQRVLHDLTPGGSEYYHNAEACYNYIRKRFEAGSEAVKTQARRAKKAEECLKYLKENR